jgi:hypothetical protein
MTPITTTFAVALALGTMFAATQVGAVSSAVKSACASDYFAHCSQHSPDSPGVRQCMRKVGLGLSKGCLGALVAAGQAPKSVLTRKLAAK